MSRSRSRPIRKLRAIRPFPVWDDLGETMHARGLAAFVATMAMTASLTPVAAADAPRINVLSTRPDLVSDGQALVSVDLPAATDASAVAVRLNGADVTGQFARRADGRFAGVLTGLVNGANTVVASVRGGPSASLRIVNHPNGGPLFSGPQLQPWPCPAGALDAPCNRPASYSYQYKSAATGQFAAYDPADPPSDVATTTTQTGRTVPFVVRVETGWADRDQYRIAVLYDPKQPWSPWQAQPAWNGTALVTQVAGCGNHHGATGTGSGDSLDVPPDVMDSEALGLGFAVMAPALDNSSHNCNVALQAESVVMLKEHFVESYGPLRYTIAEGGSGGALSQLQDTNAYPGLYQGLLPSATFPDAWSSAMDSIDCPLMEGYFEDPTRWAPGVVWNESQVMAAEGKVSPTICHAWKEVFPFYQSAEPGRPPPDETKFGALDLQNCGLSDDQLWSPTHTTGVRCTLQDAAVNLFGRRTQDGYAQRPASNLGVMYGLRALEAGTISPSQFVDLNKQIGSYDINLVWQPGRMAADPASVDAAYRSGAVNEATHLDDVAIIDQPSGNVDIHEQYRAFIVRRRLDQAHGDHDNDVIWYGNGASFPDPLLSMDKWLSAIEKDRSGAPLTEKIARDRPSDVHDICNVAGQDDLGGRETCNALAPTGQGPRGGAGGPFATDVIDCRLKPLRRSDYYPVQFSDDQWAALEKTFPEGVCDFSAPGLGQQPTVAWQTYQDANGRVITGGRPLGPAPANSAAALSSAAFRAPSCHSRRFTIRLRRRLRRARVPVAGRHARVQRRHGRLVAVIAPRRTRAARTVTVRIRGTDRKGHRVSARRRLRVCAG